MLRSSCAMRVLAFFAGLLTFSLCSASTLYLEDFQTRIDPDTGDPVLRCSGPGGPGTYPFPAGWLLRNVDNGMPDASVAYVNEAWEVREDFQSDVSNCVAFSTSWYTPVGTANDWMWTPLIGPLPANSLLSWRARAYDAKYPDGYEVRIMVAPSVPTGGTGVIGNQITNSTVVFSVAAEQASGWAEHLVALSGYTGQSIHVGFRNNSTDRFVVVVDDVKISVVSTDLAAVAPGGHAVAYSRVPDGVAVEANLGVRASNVGTTPLTNISALAQLGKNELLFGDPLSNGTLVPSLAAGASAPVSFSPAVALAESGVWTATYLLVSDQQGQDADLTNNAIELPLTSIGGNAWTRHEGGVAGTLGIGAGNGGEMGTSFTLLQPATFDGVRFVMAAVTDPAPPDPPTTWPGQSVVANLRSTGVGNVPGALIATTYAITSSYGGGVYDVRFVGGPQTLAAGTYFVGVVEPVGGPAMPLTISLQRYSAETNWVNWPTTPTGDWAALESFGASFQRVPNVSLLSEVSLFQDGFDTAELPIRASTDGAGVAVSVRESHRRIVDALLPAR